MQKRYELQKYLDVFPSRQVEMKDNEIQIACLSKLCASQRNKKDEEMPEVDNFLRGFSNG